MTGGLVQAVAGQGRAAQQEHRSRRHSQAALPGRRGLHGSLPGVMNSVHPPGVGIFRHGRNILDRLQHITDFVDFAGHHASLLSTFSSVRSFCRALLTRLFTVPTEAPVSTAASS